MSDDFDNLLARVRQGDERATRELIEKYEYEVRLTARILLGPALRRHLDSVDLTQSVHVALVEGLQEGKFEFSRPDNLVALAVTIVRRKIARHWRKIRVQPRKDDMSAQTLSESLPDVRGGVDPVVCAELQDAVSIIINQIAHDEDRRIIELRLEGFSTADAARQLGLNPDVVRVRLARLRKRLRERGVLSDWL